MKNPYTMSDSELLELAKITKLIIERIKFLRVSGVGMLDLDTALKEYIEKAEAL